MIPVYRPLAMAFRRSPKLSLCWSPPFGRAPPSKFGTGWGPMRMVLRDLADRRLHQLRAERPIVTPQRRKVIAHDNPPVQQLASGEPERFGAIVAVHPLTKRMDGLLAVPQPLAVLCRLPGALRRPQP